ncbi:hypothetical protein SCHPADRAFT_995957, partial [Schizopora paradoxa]
MLSINPMSYNEAQALGSEGCFELVSAARKTMLRLKPLYETLNKLSIEMRGEFNTANTTYKSVGRMRGIVILPSEVLARVLDYA